MKDEVDIALIKESGDDHPDEVLLDLLHECCELLSCYGFESKL